MGNITTERLLYFYLIRINDNTTHTINIILLTFKYKFNMKQYTYKELQVIVTEELKKDFKAKYPNFPIGFIDEIKASKVDVARYALFNGYFKKRIQQNNVRNTYYIKWV